MLNSGKLSCRVVITPLLKELNVCHSLLPSSEWQRLNEMKRNSRQREFASGRVLVRQLLAKQLHCPAADVELSIDQLGKPFCPHPQAPHFSISHCGEQVAVALCSQPVGIDIEQYKTKRNILKIAEHYYAKSELDALLSLKGQQEQANYFYQLWVLKEAIAKATGKGLGASINSIELQQMGNGIQRLNSNDAPMQLSSTKVDSQLWCGIAVIANTEIDIELRQMALITNAEQ